jgi:predicted  nucleic acid-binding Zn-ribbon protein
MEFDNYVIIVEFVDEYSIEILYDFINYIKDLLNFRDIYFVTSYAISIKDINTLDEAETIINKLKNMYLPDFKIYGYKSFKILHIVCEEVGFEVDFGGMSERFVSEEAFKIQKKLKDDYMRRDQKYMETISELRNGIEKMRDHISELETKIVNQSKEITRLLKNQEKLKAEVANDEKTIFAHQTNNAMLLKKIEELYAGIRNSDDLTWKEKYDELETKYKADSDALNAVTSKMRMRMKDNNEQNDETCKKLWEDINHISERCRIAEDKVKSLEAAIEGYEIKVRKLEKELKTEQTRNASLSNKMQKHRQVLFEIDDLIKKNGYRKG